LSNNIKGVLHTAKAVANVNNAIYIPREEKIKNANRKEYWMYIKEKSAVLFVFIFSLISFCLSAYGEEQSNVESINLLGNWHGLESSPVKSPRGNDCAVLNIPVPAVYEYKEKVSWHGWERPGLDAIPEAEVKAADWRKYKSISLNIFLEDDRKFELIINIYPLFVSRGEYPEVISAKTAVSGKGWHKIVLPLDKFDYVKALGSFWKFIQKVSLTGRFLDGRNAGKILISDIKLNKGDLIALSSSITSRSCKAGQNVDYHIKVENLTEEKISVYSLRRFRSQFCFNN
jgi:hypothetical protein